MPLTSASWPTVTDLRCAIPVSLSLPPLTLVSRCCQPGLTPVVPADFVNVPLLVNIAPLPLVSPSLLAVEGPAASF